MNRVESDRWLDSTEPVQSSRYFTGNEDGLTVLKVHLDGELIGETRTADAHPYLGREIELDGSTYVVESYTGDPPGWRVNVSEV